MRNKKLIAAATVMLVAVAAIAALFLVRKAAAQEQPKLDYERARRDGNDRGADSIDKHARDLLEQGRKNIPV